MTDSDAIEVFAGAKQLADLPGLSDRITLLHALIDSKVAAGSSLDQYERFQAAAHGYDLADIAWAVDLIVTGGA